MVDVADCNTPLFDRDDLLAIIERQMGNPRVDSAILQISQESLRTVDDAMLLAPILEELSITPLQLDEAARTMEWREVFIDAATGGWSRIPFLWDSRTTPGICAQFSIPYRGSSDLWRVRCGLPVQASGAVRRHSDVSGELELTIVEPGQPNHEQMHRQLEELLVPIRLSLAEQQRLLTQMNDALPGRLRDALQRRRDRLSAYERLPHDMQIRLRPRTGSPDYTPVHLKTRLTAPRTESMSASVPEPEISDDSYEIILKVIRHFGGSLEATPALTQPHGEEEIRDAFLAALNTYFEGRAAGETFRRAGKTDILIEERSRAAFVAECKVWRGQPSARAALQQLLSYTTWRDTKCALLIFNKSVRNFGEISQSLSASFSETAEVRDVTALTASEWRLLVVPPAESHRVLRVHAFLFNFFAS